VVFAVVAGVLSAVQLMEELRTKGVLGRRLAPPYEVLNAGPLDSQKLVEWVRENHFTAYHWASTCQAGVQGRVADQRFRVRDSAGLNANSTKSNTSGVSEKGVEQGRYEGVVRNLLVGSAASLPELPDANPHLTITAFSVALAEELVRAQAARRGVRYAVPAELHRAAGEAQTSTQQQRKSDEQAPLVVRRPGQEVPAVGQVAAEHYEAWKRSRGEKA
jgi:choline dehydrogenase-like flavoprotein